MSIMKRGVFDLETDGLVAQATVVWCGVVKDLETGDVLRFGRDSIPDLLLHLSSFDVLIGHNVVGFDFVILDKLYGWRYNGRVADTLLMSRTQRPNRISPARSKSGPHSVESWGVRLGLDKVENEEWGVWSPLLMERCEQDVEIQVLIFEALMEKVETKAGVQHIALTPSCSTTLASRSVLDGTLTKHCWLVTYIN